MTPLILTILMYHYVRDAGDEAEAGSGIPGLPLRHFETQLDHLTKNYTMIAWPDLQAHLQHGTPLPPAACLLTFDDGMRDHAINVTPALRARGLSGLFFIIARRPEEGLVLGHKIHFLQAKLGLDELSSEFQQHLTAAQRDQFARAEAGYRARYSGVDLFKAVLQRDLSAEAETILSQMLAHHLGSEQAIARDYYLSPAQIADMKAAGMHFGGHSHSHPWLDFIPDADRSAEIGASAAQLAGLEDGPWAFAYPYGGLAPELPGHLRTNHFIAGFTTKPLIQHSDPAFLGRLDGEALSPTLSNLPALIGIS